MSMTELFALLEDRQFEKSQINLIWDRCCKSALTAIFSIYKDLQLISKSTFQIIEFQFLLSEDLSPYLYRTKIDHKFPKRGNQLDKYKKVMLEEIVKNLETRIVRHETIKQLL